MDDNLDVQSSQVTDETGDQLLPQNTKPTCKAPRRANNEGEEMMLQLLRERNKESKKAFENIDQALAQCTASMEDIHENLWSDFQNESFKLLNNFRVRSKQAKLEEQQQYAI